MPAKVSVNIRPTVTAGLANDGGAGEPVRGADVGADRGRGEQAAPGADEGEDQHQQSGGGDDLAEQVSAAGPVLGRQVLPDVEHDVGQQRPADPAGALRERVRADLGQGEPGSGAAAEEPVRERDDRVEVRAGHRAEHEDQHRQPEHGGGAVLQQLQARRRSGKAAARRSRSRRRR